MRPKYFELEEIATPLFIYFLPVNFNAFNSPSTEHCATAKEKFLWHAQRYEMQFTESCQRLLHQKRTELLTCASSCCLQQLLPKGLAIFRAKTLSSIQTFSLHTPFFSEPVI